MELTQSPAAFRASSHELATSQDKLKQNSQVQHDKDISW